MENKVLGNSRGTKEEEGIAKSYIATNVATLIIT